MKLSYSVRYEQQKRYEKVRQVQRSQGQGKHDADTSGFIGSGRRRRKGGLEPLGDSGTVCEGVGVGCDAQGSLSAGGIVGQLLIEERERLVQLEGELERLQRGRDAQVDRIQYLENMLERLNEISES